MHFARIDSSTANPLTACIDSTTANPLTTAADQEARYLAENLNLMAKGQPSFLKGFQFQTMGNLAYVGDR